MAKNLWTKEEHIIAFNYYCRIPFSRIDTSNPDVQELAKLIGRSVNAASMKLSNFARLDPELQKRDISGLSHGSKLEKVVWDEFHNNWDEMLYESEKLIAKYKNKSLEELYDLDETSYKGLEKETTMKRRVNQKQFRNMVLASFDHKCCITGIEIGDLLISSHIVPWRIDKKNRLNPRNGLCLNALHDKAFDTGLLTITPDYKIHLSQSLQNTNYNFFIRYQNKPISLPNRFLPEKQFLEYHNKEIFIDN
ncbi:MAG: hypothetical protein MAGBODY4_01080 [Candidatus Marinimicrobia bacterium]|nr:hypothetical protein [Candidatus Neomarinimicrobiota bacterium]